MEKSIARDGGFQDVNPHCLEHIFHLAKTHQVVAAGDICDTTGTKLWAKGAPVSRNLQEKLLHRRLARPLETNLSVEGGVSMKNIIADALAKIDDSPVFLALAGPNGARSLLRDVQNIPLQGPVKLMLTSARESGHASYLHGLAAMLVCAGIGFRLQLGTNDANTLIISALLQDIGKMYIDPSYLDPSRILSHLVWKHVASHPCIGHAFIRELTSFPTAVAGSVLHHHERKDGSGYPFQRNASEIDRISSILAVADATASIALRGHRGARSLIEIALRIVPEEFDKNISSAVISALADVPEEEIDEATGTVIAHATTIVQNLTAAAEVAEGLAAHPSSTAANESGAYALSVLSDLMKGLRATGISDASQLAMFEGDQKMLTEISKIVSELSWRLRNLARNIHLRVERNGKHEDFASIATLLTALDPQTATMQ